MRRRSRAGGEPVKARRRKTATLKRGTAPKEVRRRGSCAADQETEVARLTRERDAALEQQTATSETKEAEGPDQLNPRIPRLLQVSRPIAMSTAPFSNGGAAGVQRREVAMGVYVRSRALVAANEPGTINGSPGRSYGKGRADAKNSRDY
jgi:hypothetical protein